MGRVEGSWVSRRINLCEEGGGDMREGQGQWAGSVDFKSLRFWRMAGVWLWSDMIWKLGVSGWSMVCLVLRVRKHVVLLAMLGSRRGPCVWVAEIGRKTRLLEERSKDWEARCCKDHLRKYWDFEHVGGKGGLLSAVGINLQELISVGTWEFLFCFVLIFTRV